MRRVPWAILPAIACLLVWTLGAIAQISSEESPRQRTVPVREQVESEKEHARYRLGPVRLLPVFAVRDTGYSSSVIQTSEGKVGDWTGTVSGGVRYLLPAGRKLVFRGQVVPEYTWFRELTARRSLGGVYDVGVLAFFNRLTLEAGGLLKGRSGPLSSEAEQNVLEKSLEGRGRLELEVLRRLSLFAGWDGLRVRYDGLSLGGDSVPGDTLDRTESAARAGVRYRFNKSLSLAAQVERVRVRYASSGEGRNSDGDGFLLAVRYDRRRLYVEATGGERRGEGPGTLSRFPAYRAFTFGLFAAYELAGPIRVELSGERRPIASFYLDNPYFFETRGRALLAVKAGRRIKLNGYVEAGTNTYPVDVVIVSTQEACRRQDNATSYGGGLAFLLTGNLVLTASGTSSVYRSNTPGEDRTVTRFGIGVSIQTDFSR